HQTPFPLLNFYAFLRTLVDCGLAPFFVFDSIGANTRHALKDAELVRRRVDRDRRRDLLQRSDAAHRELRAIQQALLSTAAAVAAADGAADGAVDKAVVDARHQMIRRIREYNKTAESLKGRKLPRPTPSGAAKPGGTPAEGVSADLVSVDAVLATANAAEEALETPSLDVAKLYNADGTLSNAALVRLADTIEREAKALAQRERASRALTPKYQADIRMLLDLMDIPYYTIDQIAMEAEALCAVLANSHQADRVMTEDTDALLLSEVPVITKVNHAKAPVLEINLDRGLPALGLTRPQFRDACIMAGNDFTTGMRGVGLHKATGFMRRYASLEN
ncbi:PIN domain-like protein, partial [Caulochytrium protostelioides]